MREYQRKEFDRPRLNLVRGTDGRLKSAGEEDIVDIWAEQKRMRQDGVFTEEEPQGAARQAEKKAFASKLPKIKKPSLSSLKAMRNVLRKKYIIAGASLALIMIVSFVGFNFIGQKEDGVARGDQQSPTDVLDATVANSPTFNAVLPTGRNIEDLGGWVRVSPADKDSVFAYVDTTDGVQLNVSQQELPESLRLNTAQEVEKLAQSFAANEKMAVDGITAYLGTSIRGPQSVIFVKNDLLILIKSSGALTSQQWTGYISSLR